MYETLLIAHGIASISIVILVLLQKSSSDGIIGNDGGGALNMGSLVPGMSKESALARMTKWMGFIFFLLSIVLSILASKEGSKSLAQELEAQNATGTIEQPLNKDNQNNDETNTEPTVPFGEQGDVLNNDLQDGNSGKLNDNTSKEDQERNQSEEGNIIPPFEDSP